MEGLRNWYSTDCTYTSKIEGVYILDGEKSRQVKFY